jgi:hypothetical protein
MGRGESRLDEYRLVPCSTESGELELENWVRRSKLIEEEMAERLHSDLK